jgi:hypothetical protein
MYSAKEKERRRILAQGCEKLSLGLGVLKQVDKCRRLFYELQASWKKEGTTPKKKEMKESYCGYHSKVCTTCLFENLISL